jgi:hypothetical protein
MDETAYWAVPFVFGQKERQPVSGDLHENRKVRLKAVFPVDLKAEPVNVERFALGIVGDPQRRHHTLRWILLTGHRVLSSVNGLRDRAILAVLL